MVTYGINQSSYYSMCTISLIISEETLVTNSHSWLQKSFQPNIKTNMLLRQLLRKPLEVLMVGFYCTHLFRRENLFLSRGIISTSMFNFFSTLLYGFKHMLSSLHKSDIFHFPNPVYYFQKHRKCFSIKLHRTLYCFTKWLMP